MSQKKRASYSSSESESEVETGEVKNSRVRETFRIRLGGISKKLKTLRTGRAWALQEKSGSIAVLPSSLKHRQTLVAADVAPLLKDGKTLVNVCRWCEEPGHSHKGSCVRPRHANTFSSKILKDSKRSNLSIRSFLESAGSRSATKASDRRVEAILLNSTAPTAPTPTSSANSFAEAAPVATTTTTTTTTATATTTTTTTATATASTESRTEIRTASITDVKPSDKGTEKACGAETIHKDLREEILCGFNRIKPMIGRKHGAFYAFPLDPRRDLIPAYQALRSTTFCIVDPDLVDDFRKEGYDPKCPRCNKTLKRNGICTNSMRIERGKGLFCHIVIGTSLNCPGCEGAETGSSSSSFTTLSDEIRAQMPDLLRKWFPFVANQNGAVLSIQKGFEIMSLVESGSSFLALEEANAAAVASELAERENDRRMIFRRMTEHKLGIAKDSYQVTPLKGNVSDYVNVFTWTSKLAIDFFVAEANRQMPLMQAMFMANCLHGRSLHLDMVHPWGNDGSKEGAIGIWVVLNCFGEVVVVRSAASKSLDELKGVLSALKQYCDENKHTLDVFFTDNPMQDEGTLRSVFGESVFVCKDIYHLFANVLDTIQPTSKHRRGWERAIVNSFWSLVKTDVEQEGLRLRAAGTPEKKVKRLLKSPAWLRTRKSIRHVLRKPSEISECLKKAMFEFVVLRALSREAVSTIASALDTVRKYLKVPADFVPCYNVGTDDNPHWRYLEGTSMVECFNRLLNRLHLERFSQQVGDAMVCRLAYVFSIRERINFSTLNSKLRVRDASILNDSAVLERDLSGKQWLAVEADKPYTPLMPMNDRSLYLSGLHHPVGSVVEKTLDYMVTGSRDVLPKAVGRRFDVPTKSVGLSSGRRATKPFSETNQEEGDLLMAMLGETRFYHKDGKHSLFDGTNTLCVEKLFAVASRGQFDKLVDFTQLALEWNVRFLVDDGPEISFGAHRVTDSSQIFAKEIVHFKKELVRRAALAAAKTAPETVRDLMYNLSLAEVPPTLQLVPQSIDPVIPLGVVSPSLASTVPAERVVHEVSSPPPPPVTNPLDSVNEARSASSRKTGPRSSTDACRSKKAKVLSKPPTGFPCDECSQLRHPKSSLCPFNQWKKKFENSIPRLGGEDLCAAHRRIWKEVRTAFIDQETSGFKLPSPGSNFLGKES